LRRYTAGGRKVVNDVSLEIGAGESVGIVGPSGSGRAVQVDSIKTRVESAYGLFQVLKS
jgi:ABC-type dipeptide/oligopeptide/nickel transport system ATPase component